MGARGELESISKVTQLVVPLADRPGALAQLSSVLGDAKVNIIAINAPEP